MQAVSGPELASSLAEQGGLSFLFSSQTIESQAEMVRKVGAAKKGGFIGAALNTHDYLERAPRLVEAGANVLCLDSSDGFSEWQSEAALKIREICGKDVILGGGNIVSADGFEYLADTAKLDFIKVGIGGGSICITREQKGIGRGQASAVIDVARARDEYAKRTNTYIPICSDGGITNDTQIIVALALGADSVMLGRYFAMTNESPTEKVENNGKWMKPYWGEGSERARNWQRYAQGSSGKLTFPEGVDGFVPCAGPLAEQVEITVAKLKSTLCNVGALDLKEFRERARLTIISALTVTESGTSSIEQAKS